MVTGTRAAGVVTWQVDTPGIMVVTLNRPPANALGLPVLDGLHAALDAAEASLKVMIVASAVDGFFAAGADIRHMSAADAASFAAYGDRMRAVNDRLAAAPWISVAAVDGLALGGGLELAISCTMRVSGPRARYGLPEVKLGLIPGAGGTQRLPRLIGRGRALDMMLTGRQVPAGEALAIGLVDRLTDGVVHAGDDLDGIAQQFLVHTRVVLAELLDHLGGHVAHVAGLGVDERELPLDPEGRPGRAGEIYVAVSRCR